MSMRNESNETDSEIYKIESTNVFFCFVFSCLLKDVRSQCICCFKSFRHLHSLSCQKLNNTLQPKNSFYFVSSNNFQIPLFVKKSQPFEFLCQHLPRLLLNFGTGLMPDDLLPPEVVPSNRNQSFQFCIHCISQSNCRSFTL